MLNALVGLRNGMDSLDYLSICFFMESTREKICLPSDLHSCA